MTQETKRKVAKTSFVIPFTQFDWGDYFTDTDYLEFEDHGVYWNLLKRYYTTGPFENDMKVLQRVTKCPRNKVELMQSILEEFFFILEGDGCWHHKRCDEEIRKVKGISEIQSRRARKGLSERPRDPSTGLFLAKDVSPAGAGQSPAIKEEDTRIKYERLKEERQRKDEDEDLKRKEYELKIDEAKKILMERPKYND
ncbi:MAG: hypothetical protein RLY27_2333 [Pseudomonadota bacterium]